MNKSIVHRNFHCFAPYLVPCCTTMMAATEAAKTINPVSQDLQMSSCDSDESGVIFMVLADAELI